MQVYTNFTTKLKRKSALKMPFCGVEGGAGSEGHKVFFQKPF